MGNLQCTVKQSKSFTLMKYFGTREYANAFVKGTLHMNYLGYFWDRLNCYEEQYDPHEGVVLAPTQFKLDNYLGERLLTTPVLRAEGYRYCNVACFYRVDIATSQIQNQNILMEWQEYAKMKDFGNFVVIIKDTEELMRRIKTAMQRRNFKYVAGNVNYHQVIERDIEPGVHSMIIHSDPSFDVKIKSKGQKFDSFDKKYRYKKQSEWRISLYRGLKEEEAYDLDVGDLSDITTKPIKAQNMSHIFNYLLTHRIIKRNHDYSYRGNVSRGRLNKLFLALGDNKAELSLIVERDILNNLDKLPPLQEGGDFQKRLQEMLNKAAERLDKRELTQEEFIAEIKRLKGILEKQRITLPYMNQ